MRTGQDSCCCLTFLSKGTEGAFWNARYFPAGGRSTMAIRKPWNILDVNELGMFYFHMKAFGQRDNTPILLITGDRAFPKAYAVEIRFLSIA
jgi:hypothetical protein